MYNSLEPADMDALVAWRGYATQLGLQVEELNVQSAADIDWAFVRFGRSAPDAIYVQGNAVNFTHQDSIFKRLIAARIPSMSGQTQFADAGGLIAYALRFEESAREGARYVDRVLRGAKPADLPVRQPAKLELVINAKTAKALGLPIPWKLLLGADRIIE